MSVGRLTNLSHSGKVNALILFALIAPAIAELATTRGFYIQSPVARVLPICKAVFSLSFLFIVPAHSLGAVHSFY